MYIRTRDPRTRSRRVNFTSNDVLVTDGTPYLEGPSWNMLEQAPLNNTPERRYYLPAMAFFQRNSDIEEGDLMAAPTFDSFGDLPSIGSLFF